MVCSPTERSITHFSGANKQGENGSLPKFSQKDRCCEDYISDLVTPIHLTHTTFSPCLALVMPSSRDTLVNLSMMLTRLSGAKSLHDPLVAKLLVEWVASSPLAKA